MFAKVTTGFKAGGFDSVGTYDAESNTAYEVGLKKGFGGLGQHRFNVSAFYYDYSDLQVTTLLDVTVGPQVFNAGAATIWGIDAELALELTERDNLSFAVNYLNAEYDELLAQYPVFCVGGCDLTSVGDLDPATPGVQRPDFAGNTPPFSPEFIITAGYDHVFDLGDSGTLTARAFSRFKSSYFTSFYNFADQKQDYFTQTDLSLEYRPVDETWSAQIFVQNIEDNQPLTYGEFTAAGPADILNFQFGTPRLYGIRLGVDF